MRDTTTETYAIIRSSSRRRIPPRATEDSTDRLPPTRPLRISDIPRVERRFPLNLLRYWWVVWGEGVRGMVASGNLQTTAAYIRGRADAILRPRLLGRPAVTIARNEII